VSSEKPDLASLVPPEFRGHLGFLLSTANRALVAEIDAAFANDFSVRHFAVISLLHYRSGLRQTDIAGVLGIDRTTTMKIVDELERTGMVRRTPHAEDRRANALELTAKGRAWRERMLPRVVQQETLFLDSLSEGERTLLQELLLRLVTASLDRKRTNCHQS
jgi:DNA-binding MarR family transcriptional regulator